MKHLESALTQGNQWWKYFLVITIGFFIGQMVGGIPLFIIMGIKIAQNGGNMVMPDNPMDLSAYGIDPNLGLVLVVIPFIASLFIAILLIKAFHQRSYKQVINGGRSFRWNRFWKGFLVWGVLFFASLFTGFLLEPENFEFRFNLSSFIPLVVISILLIPLQSGTEEFFFRGYLAQGVGAWTKNRGLVVLIPALLFALLHGMNPEVKEFGFQAMMPSYILFGIFFGLIAVLDDGIELAIGVHSANNMLSSIFVTNKSSALQTQALLIQKEINPTHEFWGLFLGAILFILIVSYKSNWKIDSIFKKVKESEEKETEGVPVSG